MISQSVFLTEKISSQNKRATSIVLMKESVRRYPTYAFEPHELFMENGRIKASAHKARINKNGDLIAEETAKTIDLSENCLITVRLEPPFDKSYFSAMYMLTRIGKKSYVTNNPAAIISMPEKFIPQELQKFTPPTLISGDIKKITEFRDKHGDIILKPLYEFGGRNVFRLKKDDENHISILKVMAEKYKEPIIAQKYIPEIKKGDKRIMLVEGEITWKLLRIPAKNTLQASVDLGGSFVKCAITEREKDICKILKLILNKNDIFHCGIDIIGGYLTEINVTCPALFTPINELYKIKAEKIYWDRLEAKLKRSKYLA